ncbi:MAG: amidohydrolase [Ignavibacteriae bacterium]|nr:amidohydrolase [Ignavibacteriota bacterium]
MSFRKVIPAILLIIGIFWLTGCSTNPDVVYTNGKIYTMDDKNSVVEAVAIKDGKILDVGTTSEISEKYKGSETVDLGGKIVLPGLIDTDGNLFIYSRNLDLVNLAGATSVEQIKKLLKDKIASSSGEEWIGGYGFNPELFPEEDLELITKETLDEVSTDKNIYLIDNLNIALWGNSKLFQTAGITAETQSPENGEILVDEESGQLIGILAGSAMDLVRKVIPELTTDRQKKLLSDAGNELLSWGITEVQDRYLTSDGIETIRGLIDEGKFPVGVYAVLTGGDEGFEKYLEKGIEVNYKDKLTIRSVSMDYDGAFELQDAAMIDEYKNDPKRKTPYDSDTQIESVFKRGLEKGFQLRVKAVGDLGVEKSLDAIERVVRDVKPEDHRTVLEQSEFVREKDLTRIKDLKVIPSVRPEVCISDAQILPFLINESNEKNLGLWNSLIQSAGKITAGSDFPFHILNPFVQMYYLTTRSVIGSDSVKIPNQNQKISLQDAIRAYTVWAAYSAFEEKFRGSIEKDKYADMIVISNDIFADSKNLLETKVLKTIVNGVVVYGGDKKPSAFK